VIELTATGVLLGIEGTLSPHAFLVDILMPFAVGNARSYLERCWDDVETLTACDLLARDAGYESSYDWLNVAETKREDMIEKVIIELDRLTSEKLETPGLKELQGFIWAEAYASGRLSSQVFEDVPQALACWKAGRILVSIYASRNAPAQREFFGHTEYGNLIDYFAGFFDSSTGPMTDPASYGRIARRLGIKEPDIVFVSDVLAELDAAGRAGLQTLTLTRPGNVSKNGLPHQSVPSFYDVRILQPENVV
jgi:2,3-diketo-5-methylthio-1-phosphopentane phosphatase